MLTHVARKHWFTQLPFSWGVEVVLVIALLAGTVFTATLVRGRDATIANQAVMLETARVQQVETQARMNATVTQQEEFRAQLEQGLAMQTAVIHEQDLAYQQAQAQVLAQGRIAEFDNAIIKAYGELQAQRAALEQARRGDYGEVNESTAIAEAAVARTQHHIGVLLAERQVVVTFPYTYETR